MVQALTGCQAVRTMLDDSGLRSPALAGLADGGKQGWQPEAVVAVHVRDEDAGDGPGVDPRLEQLVVRALQQGGARALIDWSGRAWMHLGDRDD